MERGHYILLCFTSAASSNLPNKSLSVSTSLSTDRVVVSEVKLQMSAKRMDTLLCLSTNSSLKKEKSKDIFVCAKVCKKGEKLTHFSYLNALVEASITFVCSNLLHMPSLT